MRTAAFAAALLLAACGTVDDDDLERKVSDLVKESTGEALKVDCPSDQSDDAGTRFTCTTSGPDGPGRVAIEVRPDSKFAVVSFAPAR